MQLPVSKKGKRLEQYSKKDHKASWISKGAHKTTF